MCLVQPAQHTAAGEQGNKMCGTKLFLTVQSKYLSVEDVQVLLYHMQAVPAQQQLFPAYSSPRSLSIYVLQPPWSLRYTTLLEETEKSHNSAYSRKFKRCLGNLVLPRPSPWACFPVDHPSSSKFIVLYFGRAASVFKDPSLTAVSFALTPEILKE